MTAEPLRNDPADAIGPGRLVAVAGPSGAGKDTLIRLAAAKAPETIVQSRVVTRPSSAAENNEEMTPAAFDAARIAGAFALDWEAHGLKYGLRRSIDDHIRGGQTVMVNVSRRVIPQLRQRYANVVAVLVTAPEDVLMARLAGRSRDSDGSLEQRLQRAILDTDMSADIVINNIGEPEETAALLVNAIREKS
jgi:ribose 1,5-bisphosphokinase